MSEPADRPKMVVRARAAGRMTRARVRGAAPFGAGIVAALMAVWLYTTLNPGPPPLSSTDVRNAVNEALASQTPGPAIAELVYAAARPSIVLIRTRGPGGGTAGPDGLGSGVVVDNQGDILTSLHVVDGASQISITFADGIVSPADIFTRLPESDIAVLRARQISPNVVPATLGNPGAVQVGDDVYVVGNPFGLTGSMSAGVISGLDRSFQVPDSQQTINGLFQIDAAVNPGNSGGALLNRAGQLIGIVTGLINPTSQDVFIGIGLAVPIDVAGGAAGLPPY